MIGKNTGKFTRFAGRYQLIRANLPANQWLCFMNTANAAKPQYNNFLII